MKTALSVILTAFVLLFGGCRIATELTVSQTDRVTEISEEPTERITVIINKNSRKYHLRADCSYAMRMAQDNRLEIEVPDLDYLREHQYEPCSGCAKERNKK